jgi:hypothetical protein
MTLVPVMAIKPHYSKKRKATALAASNPPTIREEKIAQMLALAAECGYVCEPTTKHRHQFILSITSHMVHRRGLNVYQAATYPILFPRQAAIDIFGSENKTVSTLACHTWRMTTMQQMVAAFGTMLNEVGKNVAGLARAITSKGEPTARALAMLVPPFEVSSYTTKSGSDRLHVSMMYTLWDQGGGMHSPKNAERKELLYQPAEEAEFRTQILINARQLLAQGAPLSSAWCNLIGHQAHAVAVAAAEAKGAVLRVKPLKQKKPKKGVCEVDCILKKVKSTGKAGAWYLVRWAGYEPEWEAVRIHGKVGTPLETWEPEKNLRNCSELAVFHASVT